MITQHTPETLKAFEADIAARFNRGEIRAPIHLSGGNEQHLIDIFQDVGPEDYCCGTWRSHYLCLLRGVPEERLRADILAGKSITLNYPDYRIVTSAIVGGILPTALGLAWGIRREGGSERVWCFMGEMCSQTGTAHECVNYAKWHELPIRWVVENNGKSVCTPTRETWRGYLPLHTAQEYHYALPWPHSGAGKRIQF